MRNCTPDINQNFNVNSLIYRILEIVNLMRNKHKTSKIVVKSYVILSTCEYLWTVASFLYNIF